MTGFDSLKKLKVDGSSTASYTFWDLDGAPEVVCRPANKQNKKFNAAILSNDAVRRLVLGAKVNDADVKAAEDMLVDLYADHVIVSWSGMDDLTSEKDTKCTKGNRKKFIASLMENAEWVWDDFVTWAQNSKNFKLSDAESKAKN